jgi:hypothetical protein
MRRAALERVFREVFLEGGDADGEVLEADLGEELGAAGLLLFWLLVLLVGGVTGWGG